MRNALFSLFKICMHVLISIRNHLRYLSQSKRMLYYLIQFLIHYLHLRAHSDLSFQNSSYQKKLSMQLSDIRIFNDSKSDVFLDWKLKMLNKLRYNADYFAGTNNEDFKITYIISRLGGEASTQTLWCHQYKLYSSITKLLNYSTDLYKIHSKIAKDICRQEFNKVEQVSKQLIDEFYRAFVKYFVFRKDDEKGLLHEIKRKVSSTLCEMLLLLSMNFISLSIMMKWFKKVNYRHRAAKQFKQNEKKLKRE